MNRSIRILIVLTAALNLLQSCNKDDDTPAGTNNNPSGTARQLLYTSRYYGRSYFEYAMGGEHVLPFDSLIIEHYTGDSITMAGMVPNGLGNRYLCIFFNGDTLVNHIDVRIRTVRETPDDSIHLDAFDNWGNASGGIYFDGKK